MRQPAVPILEPIVAAAWWTVGAAALAPGTGTVVLAAGLALVVWLIISLRRRHGSGARLPAGARGRLLRTLFVAGALVAVSGTVLGYFSLGEYVVPAVCAVVGIAAMSLASVLGERTLTLTGGLLVALGAAGVFLAMSSAGQLYPQGVVGMVAGAVLFLAGAYRGGVLNPRAIAEQAAARRAERDLPPPPDPDEERTVPHNRPANRPPARRGDTRRLPLPGEQDPARWGR
jgi:hypothetical protein